MKERQLREHAECNACQRKVGHTGLPLFWTMIVERHGILLDEVSKQDGLAALLGGSVRLAQVMGPDREMTQTMLGPVTLTLCEECAADMGLLNLCMEED